jgi:K+-transporting ATPase ATPase C chain
MMGIFRQLMTALRFLLGVTLIVGVLYPVVIFGFGQVAFRHQAEGSFVTSNGRAVGSTLLGQNFPGASWFHSRPSGAGADGYDALSSASSNAGPNEPSLLKIVNTRRAAVAQEEGVAPSQVPADAVTASASGLDPDISPAYAYLQAARVANNRHLSIVALKSLIKGQIRPRFLGFMGEPRVNVLELNIMLSSLK